jgi:hypothetical protein
MVTVVVQVQFPAGTVTVSPAAAVLIADWTWASEHDVAGIVAAPAGAARKRNTSRPNHRIRGATS